MEMGKFTNKSKEALMLARNLAIELKHQELNIFHLIKSLLSQDNGLIPSLLKRIEAPVHVVLAKVNDELNTLPTVSGTADVFQSREFSQMLNDAKKKAEQMQDDYVSVEHLFMASMDVNSKVQSIIESSGITKQKFMKGLQSVRGHQKVTSEDPENSFEALEKYSRSRAGSFSIYLRYSSSVVAPMQ